MTKRSKKWTLGIFRPGAGLFTDLGDYDTPQAACAAVGKKAWVYDTKSKKYVLYDLSKHAQLNRVECALTAEQAQFIYHAAYRHTCPDMNLVWRSDKGRGGSIANGQNITLSAGERVQVSANQTVEWEMRGLNWGEFGKGSNKAVVVSYKPGDRVVLKAKNKCGDTVSFTLIFHAVPYDDSKISHLKQYRYTQQQIKNMIVNIWGKKYEKVSLDQITPEIADFVQKVMDDILYKSQGMLMVDIIFNNWLTGIPKWSQALASQIITVGADRIYKGYVFETYEGWWKVRNKEKAYLAIIHMAAVAYEPELEYLLSRKAIGSGER